MDGDMSPGSSRLGTTGLPALTNKKPEVVTEPRASGKASWEEMPRAQSHAVAWGQVLPCTQHRPHRGSS